MHFGPKYSRIRSVSSAINRRQNNPETYRSGHNGTDSKWKTALVDSSAGNACNIRLFGSSNFTIKYRSCVFFLHFSKCSINIKDTWRGIEVVITGLTRNFWKLRPFRPLKMSAAQGFARVRISQFHIVLACFSCILPEQGLHLRYTESCPRGRRCDTRNVVFPKGT